MDYLRNKYGKLTSEQINNRINLRGAGSHAEVYALNEALLSREGANIEDFMIYVLSTKRIGKHISQAGIPMPRCPHCEFITDGANYFPEVLKYGNKSIR